MTKLTTGLSLREQSSLTLRIAKFPFLQINCDVANAKILDSYFYCIPWHYDFEKKKNKLGKIE